MTKETTHPISPVENHIINLCKDFNEEITLLNPPSTHTNGNLTRFNLYLGRNHPIELHDQITKTLIDEQICKLSNINISKDTIKIDIAPDKIHNLLDLRYNNKWKFKMTCHNHHVMIISFKSDNQEIIEKTILNITNPKEDQLKPSLIHTNKSEKQSTVFLLFPDNFDPTTKKETGSNLNTTKISLQYVIINIRSSNRWEYHQNKSKTTTQTSSETETPTQETPTQTTGTIEKKSEFDDSPESDDSHSSEAIHPTKQTPSHPTQPKHVNSNTTHNSSTPNPTLIKPQSSPSLSSTLIDNLNNMISGKKPSIQPTPPAKASSKPSGSTAPITRASSIKSTNSNNN